MKPHQSTIAIVLVLVCVSLSFSAAAAPVHAQKAKSAVQAWLKADPAPLQEKLGPGISRVREFQGKNGGILYYVAELLPEGFVVIAAEDLIEPVIAFSSHGHFDASEANPLVTMVSRDLPGRLAKVRALGNAAPDGALLGARKKWKRLSESDLNGTLAAMGIGSVSEVRVAPFLQTRWGQDTVGGNACYNYYTPPNAAGDVNNYPCGCVATAMAQFMRYFQHPTAGVGTASFSIHVDGLAESRSLRGGDGAGGPYDWANMPVNPSGATLTQRQAIGALTHDASVSVNAYFSFSGTAAYMEDAKNALTQTFGYSSARAGHNYGASIGPGLNGMLNPNLDAKIPVLLGVQRTGGGHAVVCDGYGYNLSTLYHHISLGWGGAEDAWYALPTIDTSLYTYTMVDDTVYNIYVSGTGEIISGRVTTTNLLPLANVQVTASGTGGGSYSTTTDSNGIYALVKLPSASSYTVTASNAGYTVVSADYSTGTSSDRAATSGNVWGADFTLATAVAGPPVILQQPVSRDVTAGESVSFSVLAAGATPFYYQWQRFGTNISGANSNQFTLPAVAESQAGPYRVIISNSFGAVTSTVATLTVTLELTRTFTASAALNLNSSGPASLYPSTINVAGVSGVLVKAAVTLNNLSHTFPDDLDVLLVGPGGQKIMLISDAGYGSDIANTTLTFDDTAAASLPDQTQIAAGTYRPSDYETGETLPGPAPAGPYGTSLSVFNATDPNGPWKLYVYDDTAGDSGTLAGGWSLQLSLLSSNQLVDHFAWSTIISPQMATAPFMVSLTAMDASNRVQSGYAGKVSVSGGGSSAILGNVSHDYYYIGAGYTDGYSFTPRTNISVTHIRHYYGEKVSIWTDAGVVVASRTVTSTPGAWVETALPQPVNLSANTRYRVGVYYAVSPNSYCRNALPGTFPHGTIDAKYSSPGDRCPTDATTDNYLVDLRYSYSVASTPTNAGAFVNGVWTGPVTFAGPGTNLTLRAADKYGHAGVSNPFDVQSAIAPPEIPPSGVRVTSGTFQMQLNNLSASRTLVVETSTNLTSWAPVFTNPVSGSTLLFTETNASTFPYRFYRALER